MAILRPLFVAITFLLLCSAQAAAQGGVSEPPESKPESQPGAHAAGMATSGVYGAIKDKQGRAITAGGFGAVVGDFDNDGWSDIYVTNFGKNRLYRNNHDGTFSDIAEKAGVALGGWSSAATWGDYDGDGRLDLFVAGYVKFDAAHPPIAGQGELGASFCQYRGENVMFWLRCRPGDP